MDANTVSPSWESAFQEHMEELRAVRKSLASIEALLLNLHDRSEDAHKAFGELGEAAKRSTKA